MMWNNFTFDFDTVLVQNQEFSRQMKPDVILSLPGASDSNSFSPPSLALPVTTQVNTKATSNEFDGISPNLNLQSTSTPLCTTRTITPSPPQHISLAEVQQIMNQISTNVGSTMEIDVSRILACQSGL